MQDTIQKTKSEQIQKQTQAPEVGVGVDVDVGVEMDSRPDIQGAAELQSALGEIADEFGVGGFKCAHPECGLVHSHSTNKHRASDDFSMSSDEAAEMEANPNCHCGLNELARRDDVSGTPSPSRANDMAPIPDGMARHLDAGF